MTIYLRYRPDKVVDREKYLNTYSASTGYKMLQGSPLLVSVEGTLIDSSTIMDLVVNRSQRVLSALNDWLLELRNPTNVGRTIIYFRWRR